MTKIIKKNRKIIKFVYRKLTNKTVSEMQLVEHHRCLAINIENVDGI